MKNIFLTVTFTVFSSIGFAQFNPYVPQVPVRAKAQVGIYKQNLYNQRYNWIQNEINRLTELYEYLFNEKKLPSDFQVIKHKSYLHKILVDYLNSIRRYDFSDNYYFNSVVENLEAIEKYYYEYYNYQVDKYNNR